MKNKILTKNYLFWDVDRLSTKKNSRFIIERILNFGDIEDFVWAKKEYGSERIKEVLKTSRQLTAKSLYFWCDFFNLKTTECLSKQLKNKPSAFWGN